MTLWNINNTLINLIILKASAFTLALLTATFLRMILREFRKH
jgi:hypothetical protein